MLDEIPPDETANWLERLESAKQGDRESLQWLLQHYWQPLWEQAAVQAGDDSLEIHSASEVVQETLIDVQHSLRDFRGQTPKELRAWLQALSSHSIRDAWQPASADKRQAAGGDQCATIDDVKVSDALLGDISEFRPSSRYQLLSRLGQGGFGVVFLARDQHLNRNVALKMPRPDVLLTKSMVQRFLREARNAAKLDHPNIVPVLATDETALMPSIVYPYCSGPTLGLWLRNRRSPPDFRLAATIVKLLADAVQHAHARGILHRDLKPSNVLLEPTIEYDQHHCFHDDDSSWIPRITDFGISKAIEADDDATVTCNVMGTLEYMAPEQIRGLVNDIGSHSDVYSLGVILYELLVKQRPYMGDSSADMILKMKDAEPPLVRKMRSEVPRDLEAIVSRCLCVSIDQRYATAAGLAEDLENFLERRTVRARKNSAALRLSRWIRRQPTVAALSGVCAVLAMIAIWGTLGYVRQVNDSVVALSVINNQFQMSRDLANAQRDRATSSAAELRNQLYAADIAAAAHAFEVGDLPKYDILLSRQIKPADEDVRELAWHYLWKNGHRDGESIEISKLPLYSVQFSNSGDLVALCGAEGVVSIYHARSHKKIISWNAEQGEVNLAAFAPDDQWIATAGDDGTICVWTSQSGKLLNRFRAHPQQAFHSLFGQGDTLISCGNENIIRVWNWRTGQQLGELNAHTATVQSIALSADRRELYSASDDGTRGIWNLVTMQLSCRLAAVDTRALDVQPATGRPFIFSSGLDGTVRRESIASDTEFPYAEIAKVTDSAECIAVSPDSRRVAIANRTGMINVVELDENLNPTQRSHQRYQRAWSAHRGRIYDLAFSPDGATLNSVGHDGDLRTWKMETSRIQTSLDVSHLTEPISNGPAVVQVAPDTCVFAVARSISLWKPTAALDAPMATTETPISRFTASVSKQMVFAGENGGRVRAWRLKGTQLEPIWSFSWPDSPKQLTGLAYSEQRNWLATAVEDPVNQVNLIDAETGIEIRQLALPASAQGDNDGDLVFSPNGAWLAGAIGNQIVVWDVATGAAKCFAGHSLTVTALAFHPNSRLLASGSADRVVKIWDVLGAEVAEMRQHRETVTSVLFSQDGQSLLSSDRDGSTAIWHTASCRLLLELDKHPRAVNLSRNWLGPLLFRAVESSTVRADLLHQGSESSEN